MKQSVEIKVVPLQECWVAQVAEIEAVSFSEPWSEQAYREILDNPNYYYVVALLPEARKAVGMCGLLISPFEGEVMNVAVHPDYRGLGVADRMLQVLLEEGAAKGITEYTLEVRVSNAPAIRLYERHGFVKEGVRPGFYSKPVEDALIMWRRQENE